jgi:zinc protease
VLPSGMRVLILERHALPTVSIGVVVARGSAQAPAGVADMATDLLFDGTTLSEGLLLRQKLSAMGAEWETATLVDAMTIFTKLPAMHTRLALALLAQVIRHAAFPADRVEARRSQVVTRMDHDASRPKGAASDELDALLYGPHHPYGRTLFDERRGASNVTRSKIIEFWQTSAVPGLATFIVAGDVDTHAVVAQLHSLLDDWSGAAKPLAPLPAVESTSSPRVILLDHPGDPQAVVRIGWLGPDRKSTDALKLGVLATSLTHNTSGRVGTLYRILRVEQGDTYGVRAELSARQGSSEFVIETSIARDVVAEALRALFAAVEAIQTRPIDEVEFVGTTAREQARFWNSVETCSDVVHALTPIATYQEPLERFFVELRGQTVTREDIQTVAKRYLAESARRMVIVGDAAWLRPALEQLSIRDVAIRPLMGGSRGTH